MSTDAEIVLSVRDVERNHHALRPLRVRSLDVRSGERIAILGMDRAVAEVFVNLVSAATLPDKGTVTTLGRPTTAVTTSDEWVDLLARVGILTERSVMLGELTVRQALAMPYTLELFDIPSGVVERINALAHEVGLDDGELDMPLAGRAAMTRARVRLANAVASQPRVLLAEHPNALVSEQDAKALGQDITRVVNRRGMAAVVLTADPMFAKTVARRVLVLDPATGDLNPTPRWQRWVSLG